MKPDASYLAGRVLALIGGAILLVLGFMFSVVLLAVVAVAALGFGGYFWWQTRGLRKAMRARPPPGDGSSNDAGHVIDGEAVVVAEERDVRVVGIEDRRMPPWES